VGGQPELAILIAARRRKDSCNFQAALAHSPPDRASWFLDAAMAHLSMIRTARRDTDDEESDAERVRRVAAGERESLEVLYRSYHRRLTRFMARLTRRPDIIEEAINDTFWIVWQKADRFRGDSRVSTWIVGIAYRCVLKALRDHGHGAAEFLEEDSALEPTDDPLASHETIDWVSKGLCRLAPEQRVALELAYGAGHSLEEIAAIMDCHVSTVKARMFHARVKLRNLLPMLAGRSIGAGEAAFQEHPDEPPP
jgi:RNA polymerase sigma-70 factor (ECF subfamily)